MSKPNTQKEAVTAQRQYKKRIKRMKKIKARKNNLLFFSKELKKYRNRRIRKSVGSNFSDAVICRLADVRKVAASVLVVSALSAVSAYALPQGGNIVAGTASISTSGGTTMLINQATNRAIVDWNKFNINADELVKFMQPGAASVILNKVIGADPSSILGALQANGRVFLVNPNGIVFGQNAAVDVAGLVATTFDIKNSDFMNGNYTFNQDTNKNLSYVINKGTIKISDNGFVFLVAPSVSNEGLIVANLGKAVLGSGKGLTVDFFGDGKITYSISGKVLDRVEGPSGKPLTTAVSNSGKIKADGGQIILTANAAAAILSSVVNNSGIIEAKSLVDKDGKVVLEGNNSGAVSNTGTIDASSAQAGANGGNINLHGEHVGNSGIISADGNTDANGGNILLKSEKETVTDDGSFISADGIGENSNGGDIRILSDMDSGGSIINSGSNIEAKGGITGDGGFIEISGNNVNLNGGRTNLSAVDGKAGGLLIDPDNLVISSNNSPNDGSNIIFNAADSITVDPNIAISTRRTDGSLLGSSTGDSGNMTLTAPTITIGSGASLLSFADSGYTGGDITLTTGSSATPSKTSIISINGSTLEGKNITISATAESDNTFSSKTLIDQALNFLTDAPITPAAVSITKADAEITIGSGSSITASNNLILKSTATTNAKADVTFTGAGVSYGESSPTAKVTVKNATINTTGDLTIQSSAASTADIKASTISLGKGRGSKVDLTLAYSKADVDAESTVQSGANITVGGKLEIDAATDKNLNTSASSGAYEDGTVGIGAAITNSTTTTNAILAGTVSATGDILINADSTSTENRTTASSAAGSGLVAKYKNKIANGIIDKIEGFCSAKQGTPDSKSGGQKVALSAAFAYADHTTNALSEIDDGANVTSEKGNINVTSKINYPDGAQEGMQVSATATVDSSDSNTKKYSAAGAIVISKFTNNSDAHIGQNAVINAGKAISVNSKILIPYDITWNQINSVSGITSKVNANLGLKNGFFSTWAQSASTGKVVGVAGSVDYLNLTNTNKAFIDKKAAINKNTTNIGKLQNVTVNAVTDAETMNLSGVFGIKGSGTGGGKGGVGGSYLQANYNDDTEAYIDSGIKLKANNLTVLSKTTDRNISIAESGGKSDKFSINGSFSLLGITNKTFANIDNSGSISANTVSVKSTDGSKLYNISGGITKGKNVGIGASVSLNRITRDTEAKIYSNNNPESLSSLGNIILDAENMGQISSWSLAAAVTTNAPTDDSLTNTAPQGGGEYGISLSGDVSINTISDTALAYIYDASINKADSLELDAKNDSDIDAVAGSAAISTASAGLAGSYTQNSITDAASAYIYNSQLPSLTGNLSLNADTTGTIKTIAASGSGTPKAGIAGSVSINKINNSTKSYIENSDISAGSLSLVSIDAPTIEAIAGSAAFGGKAGIGSGIALNTIGDITYSYITDSSIAATGDVKLSSQETSTIKAIAGAAAGSKTMAAAVAVSINNISNDTESYINGLHKTKGISASDVSLLSNDASIISSIAGQIDLSGKLGVGASVSYNEINNKIFSYITNSTVDATGNVKINSTSGDSIKTIAAGGSGAGKASIAGSVVINKSTNDIESYIDNSTVTANDTVCLLSTSDNTYNVYGGTVAIGGSLGAGGSATVNIIDNTINAFISGSSNVSAEGNAAIAVPKADGSGTTENISGLALIAKSLENINVWTANLSGGGSASVAANASVTLLGDTTRAYINNSAINKNNASANSAQTVEIKAFNGSDVNVNAGGLAIGGTAGVGGTSSTTLLNNTTEAYINNSSVNTLSNIDINSDTLERINAIVVSGAGAGTAAIAGSVGVINLDNTNEAYIAGSTIYSKGDLSVIAKDKVYFGTLDNGNRRGILDGAVAISGAVGLGGSVLVTSIANTTKAYITDSAANVSETTKVNAASTENILTYAATVGMGSYVGAAGSVIVNTIATTTLAYIENGSGNNTLINQDNSYKTGTQDVLVNAQDTAKIVSTAGAASAGIVAVGASIDVDTIKNTTAAYLGSSTKVSAGRTVSATASSDKTVNSTVLAFGGGAAAVQGAVSVVNIGSAISGDGSDAAENTGQKADAQIGGDKFGNQLGNSNTAADAKTETDNKTDKLSVADDFDTNATINKSTTAYIGSNAAINAGGDILVNADDVTQTNITAGSSAAGIGAIGGAVGIANLKPMTNAYTGSGADLSAGDDITITASGTISNSNVSAYAGSAGAVGLGAAVAYLDSDGDTNAYLGTSNDIQKAQLVEIEAEGLSDINANAVGGSAGSVAIGASIAMAASRGSTKAYIDDTTNLSVGPGTITTTGNVSIIANSADTANADARAGAAGIISGDGADSTATVDGTTKAYIGNNVDIAAANGTVTISAKTQPKAYAHAAGVNVGAYSAGISLSSAKISPIVDAYTGTNDSITANNLSITALLQLPVKGSSTESDAFGAGGGAFVGIRATKSDAANTSIVSAYIGNNSSLIISGSADVNAASNSRQTADADGYNGGIIAVGGNMATASSNAATNAYLGSEVTVNGKVTLNGGATVAGGDLTINADGNDNNYAEATSGSGGLYSGAAAIAKTENISITKAYIADNSKSDKKINVNSLKITAEHTAKFNAKSNSINASVVGGSGAADNNDVDTAVEANIGADIYIEAKNFTINATNNITKDWLSDYNVQSGSGGLFNGAAALSTSSMTANTNINVGTGTQIQVIGDPLNPGSFDMSALNNLTAYDKVRLDAAGAIVAALSESYLTAGTLDAAINIGSGDTFGSVGNISIAARSNATMQATANTETYGLAAAGEGKSKALADSHDAINIGGNTNIAATKQLNLLAGADSNGLGIFDIKANTDVFNKTAFAYSGKPAADATAEHFSTINIAGGADVASGGDMQIQAAKGLLLANGNGKASDASKWALEKLADLFGADADGALDTLGGSSTNEGSGALTLNGTLETGIYRDLQLTFGDTMFNPYYTKTDGSLGQYTIGLDATVNKWKMYKYKGNQPTKESDMQILTAAEQSKGISWTILPDQNIANNIQQNIQRLNNVKALYGDNDSSLKQEIDTQLDILNSELKSYVNDKDVDIIEVKPAYATSGDVNLWGDYIIGSGAIKAPGDVQIKITNNSPLPLKLDSLTIPDALGGHIKFNNDIVHSSSDISAINSGTPSGSTVKLSLKDAANSKSSVIDVENNFDKESGVYNPNNIKNLTNPALFISGDISNLNGMVTIDNKKGDIIATAGIRAKTVSLTAGGDFVSDSPKMLYNTGSNPEAAFKYETKLVLNPQTFKLEPPTFNGQFNGAVNTSKIVAGNNLYIDAATVNINGVVQSGIPYKTIKITKAEVGAAISFGHGKRYIPIINASYQLDSATQVVTGGISAELDTKTNQINILGSDIRGGTVIISGRIVSTGNGKINVMDGYGRINIDNETDLPVVLKDVDTGGIEGTITLIDKSKDNGLNKGLALITKYSRIGNTIKIYSNHNVDGNSTTKFVSSKSGRDSSYSPQEDMRYSWMTGTAKSGEKIEKCYHEYDKFLGFIPVSKRTFTSDDYAEGYPKIVSLTKHELPQGNIVYSGAGGAYTTPKSVTVQTENKPIDEPDNTTGTNWYWKKTSWWPHVPYPVKKTWIQRTQTWDTGHNTYHYYSVKANNNIDVSFIGYDQGEVKVTSGGDIRVAGSINNNGGITNLTSSSGSIINDTLGSIKSEELDLTARGAIGGAGSSLRVTQTAGDDINAYAGSNIYIKSVSGDLIINNLNTKAGSVKLSAERNLQLIGANPLIKGKNIYLEARNGSIGTKTGIIDIDSDAADGGEVNIISHEGNINVKEATGDIRIGLIEAAGNVTLSVPGNIINANPNQKVDTRTQAQLEALWGNMKLKGTSADKDNKSQLNAYQHSQEEAYQNYWHDNRKLTQNANGSYSYNNYDSNVAFSYSDAQKSSLIQAGWTADQIAASEQKITDNYRTWGQSKYNPKFAYTLTATETADLSNGHSWTDGELNGGLPGFVMNKVNSNIIFQTQSPNIIARNATVTAGGGIGSDLADIVYNYNTHTPASPSTMDDVKLALASAERNDLVWNTANHLLTIHQRKRVNIDASGTISLTATGRIFLGSNQDVNIDVLKSADSRIRLKVKDGIYSARTDGANNIQAKNSLILEAADGAIGSNAQPVRISLQGTTPYVTAKASGNIYLNKPEGDFYIDNIYSKNGDVALQSGGNIIDLLEDEQNDIYAKNINITALGYIGQDGGNDKALDIELSENGQLTLENTAGGANIFSEKAVQLGDSNVYGNLRLQAGGNIGVQGQVAVAGSIQLTTLENMSVADAPANLSATGNIDLSADGEFVNQGTIEAGSWLRIATAKTGSITLGGLLSAKDDIYLSAFNSILTNGNNLVTGNNLIISAANGIGTATPTGNAIETAATTITADTTNGDIALDNTNAAATTVTSLTTGIGNISFSQAEGGALTVTAATTTAGNIEINVASAALTAVSVTAGAPTIASNGDVTLSTTTSGNISVDSVSAEKDKINITSAGDITEATPYDAGPDIIAGTINLTAKAGGIGAPTDYLNVDAATALNADTTNDNANIYLMSSAGDMPVGLLNAGTGNVYLRSIDSITDANSGNNNITATSAVLLANIGSTLANIGNSTDALNTTVSYLAAESGGNIYLTNAGPLTLENAHYIDSSIPLWGYAINGSSINISASSPITVLSDVNASGNITLTASETSDDPTYGDVLKIGGVANAIVYKPVIIESMGGNIVLQAGDDIVQNDRTSIITHNQNIILTAGYLDSDSEGSITQNGTAAIQSNGGDIALTSYGDAAIALLNAGSGNVYATSSNGAIVDNDLRTVPTDYDIMANKVTLAAATGIGTATPTDNAIETAATTITADTTNGDVYLNNANSAATTVTSLTTGIGNISFSQAGGGALTLTAATTTTGNIGINVTGADLTAPTVTAGTTAASDGNIALTTIKSGNIYVDNVTAAADKITITSANAIEEASPGDTEANLTAGSAELTAFSDIGATGSIETALSNLATLNIASGNIDITNTGALNITTVGAISGITNTNGNIIIDNTGAITVSKPVTVNTAGYVTLTAHSPITVNAAVTAPGNITLDAQEATTPAAAGDNLTLAENVTSIAGNVYLYAGDDISQTAGVVSTQGGSITAEAAHNDNDSAGAFTQTDGTSFISNGGNITVKSYGDAAIALLNAGSGNVYVTSTHGAITDADLMTVPTDYDIIADNVTLSAHTGIGGTSPKEIDMSVNKIVDATTDTGGIYLGNDKALAIDSMEAGSGNIVVKLTNGNIKLGEVKADNGGVDLETANGSIIDNNGAANNIWATADSTLAAYGGIIGSMDDPLEVNVVGGKLSVLATEDHRLISVDINGVVEPSNTLDALNTPPGLITINNRMLGGNIIKKIYRAELTDIQTFNSPYESDLFEGWLLKTITDATFENDLSGNKISRHSSGKRL